MIISRRLFLGGLTAPAIVRVTNLMPIFVMKENIQWPNRQLYTYDSAIEWLNDAMNKEFLAILESGNTAGPVPWDDQPMFPSGLF